MSSANDSEQRRERSYTEHLPAYFSQGKTGKFLNQFLAAFEHILSGRGTVQLDDEKDNKDRPVQDPANKTVTGLEEIIQGAALGGSEAKMAGVHRFYAPGPELPSGERAPREFLNWLSGWVTLSFRAGLDEGQSRRFIDRAVVLYRKRGTKSGIEELVETYTGITPEIDETGAAFQIGKSRLGADEFDHEIRRGEWATSRIEGFPHFFVVSARFVGSDVLDEYERRKVIQHIVELEKPAHTVAAVTVTGSFSMQIGKARIGKDTIITSLPKNTEPSNDG